MLSISDFFVPRSVRCGLFVGVVSAAFGLVTPPAPAATTTANVCAMVSGGEIGALFGKKMQPKPPEMDLPQSSGCDWEAADGKSGFMTVRIIPPRYLPEPKLGKSFAILDGIGNKANIVEDMGGWNVGAIKGAKAVVIHVDGGKSSRSMAVTMLKKYVQKL
ncbi:MAG: hypothetical protein JWO85_1919 [Candidatus Eremiobacteraeota bacterium]|jgi:hypothetical protein|nr:hypothetical protein [Candidatus Eremiobacteraeota bacterium]